MKVDTFDLHFLGMPHAIASYLVVGPQGEPVLVETGPTSTLPAVLQGLAAHGYQPGDVRHVLLTHIHLDHAGAAGWWARQKAQIYVHHVGAPHLVDPTRLLRSAGRIYGDMMDRLWGEVLPVPAERLTPLYDGDRFEAGGLTFTALDSPGHAKHHHVYRLGDVAFTGDIAGVRLQGQPLIFLPTPPPDLDVEAWRASLRRLMEQNLATLYPTHFGAVRDVPAHLRQVQELLDRSAEFVGARLQAGLGREQIIEEFTAWNRQRAATLNVSEQVWQEYESADPLYMSVDGLIRYWQKQWEER